VEPKTQLVAMTLTKRLKAGWNDDYLLHVLQGITDDVVR
jgi:hypothetical protein